MKRFRRVKPAIPGGYGHPFSSRHPFQMFVLFLCFISGLPLVVSLGNSEPGIPAIAVLIWGFMLTAGSGLALVGTYWPSDAITRMTLERVGLSAAGYGALIYGAVLLLETPLLVSLLGVDLFRPDPGGSPPFIFFIFTGVCLKRCADISGVIQNWAENQESK